MGYLRTKIADKYKNIHSIGCAAHMMNLLIKDIEILDQIKPIVAQCRKIVVEIKNSNKKLARFSSICAEFKTETGVSVRKLKLNIETR